MGVEIGEENEGIRTGIAIRRPNSTCGRSRAVRIIECISVNYGPAIHIGFETGAVIYLLAEITWSIIGLAICANHCIIAAFHTRTAYRSTCCSRHGAVAQVRWSKIVRIESSADVCLYSTAAVLAGNRMVICRSISSSEPAFEQTISQCQIHIVAPTNQTACIVGEAADSAAKICALHNQVRRCAMTHNTANILRAFDVGQNLTVCDTIRITGTNAYKAGGMKSRRRHTSLNRQIPYRCRLYAHERSQSRIRAVDVDGKGLIVAVEPTVEVFVRSTCRHRNLDVVHQLVIHVRLYAHGNSSGKDVPIVGVVD